MQLGPHWRVSTLPVRACYRSGCTWINSRSWEYNSRCVDEYYARIFLNTKAHNPFTRALILRQINPLDTPPFCFLEIHFNIILYTPRSYKWSSFASWCAFLISSSRSSAVRIGGVAERSGVRSPVGGDRYISSSAKCPDSLWGAHGVIFSGCGWGGGREVDHSI